MSCEPTPSGACEPNIAVEPEMPESDQVQVPAVPSTAEGAILGNVSAWARGAHDSAYNLGRLRSSLTCCPDSRTYAPHPFQHGPSTLQPHQAPSVSRHHLGHIGTSALLSPPSGSATDLGCFSSTSDLPTHTSSWEVIAAARVFYDAPSPRPFGYAVGSYSGVIASNLSHGGIRTRTTMAPPTSDTTMEHSSGCDMGTIHHAPAQGSSLALTTFSTALDPSVSPPPGQPSSSGTSFCILCLFREPFTSPFTIPFTIPSPSPHSHHLLSTA
ncbi:hypothetical protein DPX16_17354 [Anabarilius grahami]|uniref:Uncharacterized protein n=1 Tax=Anabarilius grahami TaxID=495550 RepID=A0A3N0XZ19_ANAGA|nr:hypothetical protein DPX16_17354 [Anabarilius grahami]